MAMKNSLRRVLAQGSTGGVFFLYGEDEHRKGEAAQALVDAHLDPGTRDFNLDVVQASEVSVEDLARILATPPMMAERRVIVVRGVEAFAGAARSRDLILRLVENPPSDLALILSARIPERSKAKFYQTLIKRAQSVEFAMITPDDVPGWLMEEATVRFGATMEPDAARALGQAIGADLGILSRELEKLTAVAGDEDRITLDHVRAAGTCLAEAGSLEVVRSRGGTAFPGSCNGCTSTLESGRKRCGSDCRTVDPPIENRLGGRERPGGPRGGASPSPEVAVCGRSGRRPRDGNAGAIRSAVLGLLRVDRLLKASSLSDEHHLEEWLLTLMAGEDVAA